MLLGLVGVPDQRCELELGRLKRGVHADRRVLREGEGAPDSLDREPDARDYAGHLERLTGDPREEATDLADPGIDAREGAVQLRVVGAKLEDRLAEGISHRPLVASVE